MAFREIYQRYWKKLYNVARRKVQDLDTVEELVQDIFLRLWERRGSLRIDRLDAYLFTAIRYAIINHYQGNAGSGKNTRAMRVFASTTKALFTTDDQMDLNELMNAVEQHLTDLPEKTRQIFRLNRLECQTVKEISSQLKVPERRSNTTSVRPSKPSAIIFGITFDLAYF